ncbi:antirestriction protein ArdA [Longicatena caecimuris]|uniref:antirestriction protein ArdA n=1 Tax=Longicatena caecimuris TaxID=1796635 RepID=UPI0022E17812|nr:antirestriction protein ArdA [Longicatena caecimuris]
MQELRVLLETTQPINDEIRSAWFALPIDKEELQERLGVDIESEDYRILEKELPFADDVGEDTTIERLNDMYRTFESLPADFREDYEDLMCHFSSLDELHQHRNDIIHYSWCKNMPDVAHRVLDNDPAFSSVEERITRYFDFEAYGQYLDDNGRFLETEHGIYEIP